NHADRITFVVSGGGGIAAFGGALTVADTGFTGNHADASFHGGGGVLARSCTLTVDLAEFTGNQADRSGLGGRGIPLYASPAEIDPSTISGTSPADLAFAAGGPAHLKQTVVGATRYRDAPLS